EGSLALLSALAHGIGSRRMLLVLSHDPEAAQRATPALANLFQRAQLTMTLDGFSHDEVHQLVRATFGAIDHTELLADWLHELTSGSPQGCIDLMHHLIEQQVIRFIDGVWVLP